MYRRRKAHGGGDGTAERIGTAKPASACAAAAGIAPAFPKRQPSCLCRDAAGGLAGRGGGGPQASRSSGRWPVWRGRGLRLLGGCKAGLDAWRACKDAGGADGPRLQAFVDGMLDALADGLAGIEITFADGESWSPHSGAAFAGVPAGRPYTVAYRPSSTPDRDRIRSILHTLALNRNIRAILAQAGTAQAI